MTKKDYEEDEEEDEEEEYEEEDEDDDEDNNLTLQDIKDGLDVVDKGIDVWNKLKKQSNNEFTKHPSINEIDLDPNKFRRPTPEPKPKIENFELAEHPDIKVEKRHKEIIKWAKIAIVIGGIIGVITIIIQLV